MERARLMKTIENNIYEVTSSFAIRIVNLYKYLTETNEEQYTSLYKDWNVIMGVLTKIVKATKP